MFIGVDAAWGDIKDTGVVALTPSGTVIDAGLMRGITQTTAPGSLNTLKVTPSSSSRRPGCPNTEGQRFCDKQVGLSAVVRRPYHIVPQHDNGEFFMDTSDYP